MSNVAEPNLKILKKGTLVKHGTTSRSLQGIIDQGIRPKAHQYHFRSTIEEAPTTDQAVYVGQYMAYCAAMLSFMDLVMADAVMPSPKQNGATPIVFNIRLGDDCVVVADEDFVLIDKHEQYGRLPMKYRDEFLRSTHEEGIRTWEGYGSVGIVRPDGIPTTWIESFEHPQLELRNTPEIYSDIELMLFGYRQQQEGRSLKEMAGCFHEFEIQKEEFSQRHAFNDGGFGAYTSQEVIADKRKRQQYCRALRSALLQLGSQKHGLPFH